MSVLCPDCCVEGEVIDTRLTGNSRKRKRRCKECGSVWFTEEAASENKKTVRQAKLDVLSQVGAMVQQLEKAIK